MEVVRAAKPKASVVTMRLLTKASAHTESAGYKYKGIVLDKQ